MDAPSKVRLVSRLIVYSALALGLFLLLEPFFGEPGGFQAAHRVQAKNDASVIATAIQSYLAEYGELPTRGTGNVNSVALMEKLAGVEGDEPKNTRRLCFVEVPTAKRGCNGVEMSGEKITSAYKDSWGNDYEIRVASAGDGQDHPFEVTGPDGERPNLPVIVWSRGNPKRLKNGQPNYVKSWE